MKVISSVYKGIHYVPVSALPHDQKEKLLNTINRDLFIKILVDGKLLRNCLQFKDYEVWFDNVFMTEPSAAVTTTSLPVKTALPVISLALKKS